MVLIFPCRQCGFSFIFISVSFHFHIIFISFSFHFHFIFISFHFHFISFHFHFISYYLNVKIPSGDKLNTKSENKYPITLLYYKVSIFKAYA